MDGTLAVFRFEKILIFFFFGFIVEGIGRGERVG